MKLVRKILLGIVFSFIFCFICIGYAVLTDELSISGSLTAEAIDHDELVITNISSVSSSASSSSVTYTFPTNVKTTFTGSAGQEAVYKITVKNYSDTLSYVYTGTAYSSEFASVANKLSISASTDSSGSSLLPNNVSAKHTQGTVINPGDSFTFYATYKLTGSIAGESILVNYSFKPVIYTVTYLNDNETFAVDCITDNSTAYTVRTEGPPNENLSFAGWINASAEIVNSYPAGNTNDYTLSAKWDNVYLIIFADADGTVLYEESFTSSSTKLSDEGQAIVDAKLAELNAAAAEDEMTVSWSSYDIASATSDITVKAIYNYSGYLNLVPVYEEPDDGIVDYYMVQAVDTLPATVVVPGSVGGVPVTYIDRITNIDGENDWNNYENNVTTIIIEEGIKELNHNALSYTPNLKQVQLPSSLEKLGKNTFSRNDIFGNDKKTLTVTYNGTVAEWKQVIANSDKEWANGLKEGSQIRCSDGYFVLERSWLSLSWSEKKY